jgi:hypothetical protein
MEDENVINITEKFWNIINDIVNIETEKFKLSDSYNLIKNYTQSNKKFKLQINQYTLYFENINDLFYNTLTFLKNNLPTSNYYNLLSSAIYKIEHYIDIENISESLFTNLSL